MRWRAIGIIVILALVGIGCAHPKPFEPFKPPEIKFEKTAIYELDITKLKKPDKPVQIWLDEKFKPTEDETKVQFIAFAPSEFAKIVALNRLYNDQQEIIVKQIELVNLNIEIVNSLKQLMALKNAEINEYISLWANAENAYRSERYEHQMNNLVNRTAMYLIAIGSVILLAVGL